MGRRVEGYLDVSTSTEGSYCRHSEYQCFDRQFAVVGGFSRIFIVVARWSPVQMT